MKNEVVMLGGRIAFDSAIRLTGAKLIIVPNLADLPAAINDRTAMVYTTWRDDQLPKALAITKKANVPLLLDDAAGIPPFENLSRYANLGVDFIASAAARACAVRSAPAFCSAAKTLIDAALKNYNPNEGAICRAMKVGKEEIMGMLAAIETWKKIDHHRAKSGMEQEGAAHCQAGRNRARRNNEDLCAGRRQQLPHSASQLG